jgi:glycosyltransferase involved in cell wall biosynthesis
MTGAPLIAIFAPSMSGGGAERILAVLANGFASRGFRVDLLLARAKGPYLEQLSAKVHVIDLGKEGVASCLIPLVHYLRQDRPNALLSFMSHTNVIALLARRLARSSARLVISERSSYRGMVLNVRTPKQRLIRALMRLTYKMADAIIVVADEIADELHEDLGVPLSMIHSVLNPVVNSELQNLAETRPNHEAFDGEQPVILAAGRLSPEKDFATLLRAFSIIRRHNKAKLVIIGEGEERSRLGQLARQLGVDDNLYLPGFQANPFSFMRAASVFVLSSRFEGMPSVLVQAMACGTPVVATDCPTGPRQILERGRWGRLVPVGDHRALAVAIETTLSSKRLPAVRKRALDFDEDTGVRNYLHVLLGGDSAIAPQRSAIGAKARTKLPPKTVGSSAARTKRQAV